MGTVNYRHVYVASVHQMEILPTLISCYNCDSRFGGHHPHPSHANRDWPGLCPGLFPEKAVRRLSPRTQLCPQSPRRPVRSALEPSWGRRSGARGPAHQPPWAKSGRRGSGAHPLDEEALLEHAAVLHVATCEPSRCAVPAPQAPPRSSSVPRAQEAPRTRAVPPPWPASRTWAPGRPGRKSDLVGIPDVPRALPRCPG